MEERRAYITLEADVQMLKQGQERLLKLLEGNGQPGFIAKTQEEIEEIKIWQIVHEDRREQSTRNNRRWVAYAAVAMTIFSALVNVAIKYFEKH